MPYLFDFDGLRGFHARGVVEGVEGLQGGVAAVAFEHAELAAGRIKADEGRIWRRAAPKGVDAAAMTVLAVADRPAVAAVGHVPHALGLEGHHAGSTNLGAEQAADRQRVVAHELGIDAEARGTRHQPVVGILLSLAGEMRAPWRYVAEVTISRCSFFIDQPPRTNSLASQSSSSGWLGLPAIALAGFKEMWELHKAHLDAHGWSVLAVGLVVASVSAFVAIWGLMRILERFSAWPFVVYRGLLGVGLLVGLSMGWLT